jgi:hypothetical protein
MRIATCKVCGSQMAKSWVGIVTKWICLKEECSEYDKPVNS